MATKKMTMGLIVGNRGFFPHHLAKSGREEMLRVLAAAGIDVVALTPEESEHGAVETRQDSRRCADLFKKNRDRIDGVIVTLPNFGEERAIADTLRQYGIPYSITTLHTESPSSPEFAKDLQWFAAVCRIVNGFRNLRVGAIGARPTAFNTVRYSEKILESQGISIETLDLSEVLGRIERMQDNDDAAQVKLSAIMK